MDDQRLLTYHAEPNSKEYKGYKLDGSIKKNKATGLYRIIMTNGENKFVGSGYSFEQALIETFDRIDKSDN